MPIPLSYKEKNKAQVTAWRKRNEKRVREAFGGKCGICGYCRCAWALEFHHLDSQEKEYNISRMPAFGISWARIVKELRKCVLLCANCHREVEMGLTEIPKDIRRFDESYANYVNSRGMQIK